MELGVRRQVMSGSPATSHKVKHSRLSLDLSHLLCEQQEIVKMSRKESGSFATDDDDIGCAEQLKLEINSRDNNPV